mmetsp:Transcript_7710/g.10725  ORF Transcript_7710/g.10725 Transcript_7710/m.10725 type:complete len:346 (-) Transcript_7710:49-1086(-)
MAHDQTEKYRRVEVLGKGRWGLVHRGIREIDGLPVAIKDVQYDVNDYEGLSIQIIREIKMLRNLCHEYVVSMLDVERRKNGLGEEKNNQTISMVFELLATDLEVILYHDKTHVLGYREIKGFVSMMLQGLDFLHCNFVLHRDIKPANLLVSTSGILRLADFGYSRYLPDTDNGQLSYGCCTLWYRAPELLFGATQYSFSIDNWAAGCVIAELALVRPLFQASSNIGQLASIFRITGTPNDLSWPGVSMLKKFIHFKPKNSVSLLQLLQDFDQDRQSTTSPNKPNLNSLNDENENTTAGTSTTLAHLVSLFLINDPKRRQSCADALRSPFFHTRPFPSTRPRGGKM